MSVTINVHIIRSSFDEKRFTSFNNKLDISIYIKIEKIEESLLHDKFDFIRDNVGLRAVHGFVFIAPQGSDLKIGKKLITANCVCPVSGDQMCFNPVLICTQRRPKLAHKQILPNY